MSATSAAGPLRDHERFPPWPSSRRANAVAQVWRAATGFSEVVA